MYSQVEIALLRLLYFRHTPHYACSYPLPPFLKAGFSQVTGRRKRRALILGGATLIRELKGFIRDELFRGFCNDVGSVKSTVVSSGKVKVAFQSGPLVEPLKLMTNHFPFQGPQQMELKPNNALQDKKQDSLVD